MCFGIAGENLTARLRLLAFKAMLRQDIGWFDEEKNSSCVLACQLAEDTAQVQGATGNRLGSLLETFVSMTMSIAIAFVYSWALTLVILAVIPILLIIGALEAAVLSRNFSRGEKLLDSAGKVVNNL